MQIGIGGAATDNWDTVVGEIPPSLPGGARAADRSTTRSTPFTARPRCSSGGERLATGMPRWLPGTTTRRRSRRSPSWRRSTPRTARVRAERAEATSTADAGVAPEPAGGCMPTTGVTIPGSVAQILPDGTAAIPTGAPIQVQDAIAAGNRIIDTFYSQERRANMLTQVQDSYDCSGATDFVLYNAGLSSPQVDVGDGVAGASGQLENYGDPRPRASGSASMARPATPSSRSPASCSTPRTTHPSSRRACRTPTRPMTRPTAGRPAARAGSRRRSSPASSTTATRGRCVIPPDCDAACRARDRDRAPIPSERNSNGAPRRRSGVGRAVCNGQRRGPLLAASVAERERRDRFAALLRSAGWGNWAARTSSSGGTRRLCEAHDSASAGGHDHPVDAATAKVARRSPVRSVAGALTVSRALVRSGSAHNANQSSASWVFHPECRSARRDEVFRF